MASANLKSDNKAKLLIMLFFCGLFAVVLPFLFEDGYLFIYICLGIAAFLTLSALVLTWYGVRRLRQGNSEFILSLNGAYALGGYYAWNMPGTSFEQRLLLSAGGRCAGPDRD